MYAYGGWRLGALGWGLVLLLLKRRSDTRLIVLALKSATATTCTVLTITIGAMMFSQFLAVAGFSGVFREWVGQLPFSAHVVMVGILLLYIALGCVMDALSMQLLTVPIIFPVIMALGFNPIWFGVICVLTGEMGLITPPVGMVSYMVSGITGTPLEEVFRGILPFFVAMCAGLVLLCLVPQIATFLPTVLRP
jgi:TRAP-type C4-dicarboxylate transport system permease large subunit